MAILILIIIWKYALGYWNMDQVVDFMILVAKYSLPGATALYILYKTIIEKIVYFFGRKKSAKIIAYDIPKNCQVDGPKRSGKDASTTGESIILREQLIKDYKKEIKLLKEKLYLYDFDKLHKKIALDIKKLTVGSEYKFNKAYETLLVENNCFIHEHWINQGTDPKKHLNSWKFRSNKRIPDIAFEDGITPGGKHTLHLLKRYVTVYIRITYIPNYIISNQPIIEEAKVSKKTGAIKTLFSKIFSLDYISLKMKTPMPFPIGVIITETETAMYYSNTDKALEVYIKNESGVREFHTVEGHLLQEEAYIRGITQDKDRPNKTIRELYEGYMHVFSLDFYCTSDIFRLNYALRRVIQKLLIVRLKVKNHFTIIKKLKPYRVRKIRKHEKRISILHQKDLKKWAKGYIVFKKGVYSKIEDSGKKVKYPLFYGLKDSSSTNSAYSMHGFKQVNKITDCFGRYDTHMMKTVRDTKEQIYSMHFNDVPNWSSMKISVDDMDRMNYPSLGAMNQVYSDHKTEERNIARILRTKNLKKSQRTSLPDFENLTEQELLTLCLDLGIDESVFDMASEKYRNDIEKLLKVEYKSFNGKDTKK